MATPARFMLTRRVPRQLRLSVPKGVSSRLEAWPCGVTYFRGFDVGDPWHYHLLEELIRGVIALDRKNQVFASNELKRAGFWELLGPILESRSEEAFAPDYVDLWNLYSYVRARRPRCILEFGSGLSTLVMAFALHQNGEGGTLFSVEPLEDWEAETRRLLPKELAGHCEVRYSPPTDCRIAGVDSVRFAKVPDVAPDFIYLDGAPEGAKFQGAEEIHLLEECLAPGAAVMIDGRTRALFYFLQGHAKRKWQVRAQAILVELPEPMRVNPHFGLDQYANGLCALQE